MAVKRHIHARAISVLVLGYLVGLVAFPKLPGPFLDVKLSARILVAFTLPTTALVIYTLFRSLWVHDRIRGSGAGRDREPVAPHEAQRRGGRPHDAHAGQCAALATGASHRRLRDSRPRDRDRRHGSRLDSRSGWDCRQRRRAPGRHDRVRLVPQTRADLT